VYICLVVDQDKGSPGTTAARMVLTQTGRQFGTVGGGIMERRVLDSAQKKLNQNAAMAPRLQFLRHRKEANVDGNLEASGLICGGAQTNLEVILTAADAPLLERIVSAAELEAQARVCFTSAGIRLDVFADAPAPESVPSSKLTRDGPEQWEYSMCLRNMRRIVIYGGGHCGVALAQLMWRLDYAVSLVEPRRELPALKSLPDSVQRIHQEFISAASQVSCPSDTIAIVMTYSMLTDIEALKGALPLGFKQLGLMGSPIKIAHVRDSLKQSGFDQDQIDLIRAPIGLSFNSDTPDEIAVSIAAQILLERNST
jgi:xanthine dehydrogenase accessory factor